MDIVSKLFNVERPTPKDFPSRDLFDVVGDSGYRACGIELNDDVLTVILSHVPLDDLVFNCRLVCKAWCNIIDTSVWQAKLSYSSYRRDLRIRTLPWHFLYWILKKKCLGRNFVKNPDGKESFEYWTILSNGGHKWKVESPPSGTEEPLPSTSCFANSFHSCSKEQIIDLVEEGAPKDLLDNFQPDITVSEWYAGRWDCRSVYELEINLIKDTGDVVDDFTVREHCGGEFGSQWRQVSHTFRYYGRDVRYVRFYHGGVDEQFWAGHYGSKMTGACVQLTLP